MNIFKSLISKPEIVTEEFLENNVIDDVLNFFESSINHLSGKAYGSTQQNPLARKAFKEKARSCIIKAILSFFKKKKYLSNDPDYYLKNYISSSIYNLEKSIKNQDFKKVRSLTCPACHFFFKKNRFRSRSFLNPSPSDKDLLNCEACSEKEKNLTDSLSDKPYKFLHKTFSSHSKSGFKCKSCCRFLPESIIAGGKISCPYPDCDSVALSCDLEKTPHPFTFVNDNQTLSIDVYEQPTVLDYRVKKESNIEFNFETIQNINNHKKLVENVLKSQLAYAEKNSYPGTKLQKTLMHEAFINCLNKHPEDMINYLINNVKKNESPIQSKIFQEYADLVQDTLPYTIDHEKEKHEVVSLFDPKISLFDGISKYDSEIKDDLTVPNETKERYIGGNQFKDYGPCFIGYLKDIVDKDTGESLKKHVKEYGFVKIKLNNNVKPGTKVKVIHYRIPSHYEMGPLVYLQRVRKKIGAIIAQKNSKGEI